MGGTEHGCMGGMRGAVNMKVTKPLASSLLMMSTNRQTDPKKKETRYIVLQSTSFDVKLSSSGYSTLLPPSKRYLTDNCVVAAGEGRATEDEQQLRRGGASPLAPFAPQHRRSQQLADVCARASASVRQTEQWKPMHVIY